jgi:uncharacterized membrane protein YkoI
MPRSLVLALAMLVALVSTAAAGPGPRPTPKKTLAEAEALALQAVPGTVVEAELEKEHGRWVYSVEIRPATRGPEVEVLIDADSGATVAIEEDDDDDDHGSDHD